jgi:antitoxin component of RelBE/YafQ-DinJ toxin-antitoxin module
MQIWKKKYSRPVSYKTRPELHKKVMKTLEDTNFDNSKAIRIFHEKLVRDKEYVLDFLFKNQHLDTESANSSPVLIGQSSLF